MLFGIEVADAFLARYQYHAGGSFSYNPYWDILSLLDMILDKPVVYPGWAAFGVSGLTDELMVERVEKYLLTLLVRI